MIELGVGLGLHARIFLDRFAESCRMSGTDFYQRLTYFATNTWSKMLDDLAAAGTLAPHWQHVSLGSADALRPSFVVQHGSRQEMVLREVRCVVCNYVLDVLPYDVLLREEGKWFRLHLRTVVERGPGVDSTLANRLTPTSSGVDPLFEVQGQFDSERAFFPVDVDTLPFGDRSPEYVDEVNVVGHLANGANEPSFVHSHGALTALTGALGMLRADGFVLYNDYGSADPGRRWEIHSRYGGSRAVAVNFALLDFLLPRIPTKKAMVGIPPRDGAVKMHSRLLTLKALPELEKVFAVSYDAAVLEELMGLVAEARRINRDDIPTTRSLYQRAHDRFPENWAVLAEWSQFEVFVGGDIEVGLGPGARSRTDQPDPDVGQ